MSTLVGLRKFNRSQAVRVGGKAVTATGTTLVNIDSKRVARDISRHSAIGAVQHVTPPIFQNDDGTVDQGGSVTTRATTLVLDVAPVFITRADGTTKVSNTAAQTVTLATADATNPRVDTVVIDTTSGTVAKIDGTATAGANSFNLTGKATVPANRVVLAYVIVPATATNITQSAVVDARP
jgi:hypothetical protein